MRPSKKSGLAQNSKKLLNITFFFSDPGTNPKPPAAAPESPNLFLSVDSLDELKLLTNIRNELRSSPVLKSLLLSKLDQA